MNKQRSPAASAMTCVLLWGFGSILSWWLAGIEAQRHQYESRNRVQEQLSTLRAAVERSLNERIYLTLGLRAFVSTHPDVSEQEFAVFASALMAEGEGIRSVTLIKDNVISDVFPREGNGSALGVKLLEIPDQRDDVLRAIETKKPWLSGPIKLVQGGEAFVNRAPVYVTPAGGPAGSGRYWGMVSILISKQQLLDDIIDGMPANLRLAMRLQSPNQRSTTYFLDDESIEATDPLLLDVNLPTGDWQVLAVPRDGWSTRSPTSILMAVLGILASTTLSILTYMLLRSNTKLKTARQTADDAVVQLSRKNEDLELFVRSASHDLRAPLRHIHAFSQLLFEDAGDRLNQDGESHLNRIQQASKNMTGLLDSLLEFAKTGSQGLSRDRFDLNQAVRDVVDRFPLHDVPKIEVGDLPEVHGDRDMISQVFQNLIANALKYNQSAGASVKINATESDSDVTIAVEDNGIGLSPEEMTRIFEPGARGLRSHGYDGTGFGLAISDRIVKAHQGKIWCESDGSDGSTFYISLPKVP